MTKSLNVAKVEGATRDLNINWAIEGAAEVESTNSTLLQAAQEGAPEGTILVADHQTAGRGRQGREWIDRPGADLLVSLILRPQIASEDAGLLSLLPSVAASVALAELTGEAFHTKWPNDIMTAGRKVGGVLAEANLDAPYVVLGVGINLLGEASSLPEKLIQPAATVQDTTGAALKREDVLCALLQHIEQYYGPGGKLDGPKLIEVYRLLEITTGRRVTVAGAGEEISGRVQGVDDHGHLLVEVGDRIMTFSSGDIHIQSPL
ncbi:MAG: biotin--[acetyl-CoA-carboxylase] ligase [Armatimonadota bacterium]